MVQRLVSSLFYQPPIELRLTFIHPLISWLHLQQWPLDSCCTVHARMLLDPALAWRQYVGAQNA